MGSQVNDGLLECFILLQMLGQCVAVAKMVIGFKGPNPRPLPKSHKGTMWEGVPAGGS